MFYYLFQDGELKGAVQTHVDDFNIAATKWFIDIMIEGVAKMLTISKVERGKFWFTGLDVLKQEDNIVLSMSNVWRMLQTSARQIETNP